MRTTVTANGGTVLGTADGGRRRIEEVTVVPHGGCPYLEIKVEDEAGGREYQLAGPAALAVVKGFLKGMPAGYLATDPELLAALAAARNAGLRFSETAKAN